MSRAGGGGMVWGGWVDGWCGSGDGWVDRWVAGWVMVVKGKGNLGGVVGRGASAAVSWSMSRWVRENVRFVK